MRLRGAAHFANQLFDDVLKEHQPNRAIGPDRERDVRSGSAHEGKYVLNFVACADDWKVANAPCVDGLLALGRLRKESVLEVQVSDEGVAVHHREPREAGADREALETSTVLPDAALTTPSSGTMTSLAVCSENSMAPVSRPCASSRGPRAGTRSTIDCTSWAVNAVHLVPGLDAEQPQRCGWPSS